MASPSSEASHVTVEKPAPINTINTAAYAAVAPAISFGLESFMKKARTMAMAMVKMQVVKILVRIVACRTIISIGAISAAPLAKAVISRE